MAVTAYATTTELDQIFSEAGILGRTDDHDDGEQDSGLTDAALEQASAKINQFLFQRGYSVAVLSASTWVKWCCAYLAVRTICIRQGDGVPQTIQDQYEECLEELTRIRDGQSDLASDTGLATPSHDHLPSVSNLHVDSRYRSSKIRRVKSTSSGSNAEPPTKQNDFIEHPHPYY